MEDEKEFEDEALFEVEIKRTRKGVSQKIAEIPRLKFSIYDDPFYLNSI